MQEQVTGAWECTAMAEGPARIACLMQEWADAALDYAILFAVAGTMAMAVVDLLNGVFRIRARYHRKQVDNWIGAEECAHGELIALAAGGSANEQAWWDQSTEQLFARLRAAAETSLDFPEDYVALYSFLTEGLGGRSLQDAAEWRVAAPAWTAAMRPGPGFGGADPGETGAPAQPSRDPADLRARVGAAVSRSLDALQMGVEWRWTKLVQSVAVPLGAALFYAMQFGSGLQTHYALPLSLVGGLMAPFAKDIVTRLSGTSLRGRFGAR